MPDIGAKCCQYRRTVHQDGAPLHTAKNTINYLKRENVSFIKPQMWPPNSPDLSSVDYAVCGALQQQVCHNWKFTTVSQLKQAIVEEWNKLSQSFIDRSIDEWRRRLTRVGHIEHVAVWISSSECECWNCSNSVNIWCFVVYMTLYWRSW